MNQKRQEAITSLGTTGDSRCVGILHQVFDYTNCSLTRKRAVRALGEIGHPSSFDRVKSSGIESSILKVRHSGVFPYALCQTPNSPSYIPAIVEYWATDIIGPALLSLEDPQAAIRVKALEVLVVCGESGDRALLDEGRLIADLLLSSDEPSDVLRLTLRVNGLLGSSSFQQALVASVNEVVRARGATPQVLECLHKILFLSGSKEVREVLTWTIRNQDGDPFLLIKSCPSLSEDESFIESITEMASQSKYPHSALAKTIFAPQFMQSQSVWVAVVKAVGRVWAEQREPPSFPFPFVVLSQLFKYMPADSSDFQEVVAGLLDKYAHDRWMTEKIEKTLPLAFVIEKPESGREEEIMAEA